MVGHLEGQKNIFLKILAKNFGKKNFFSKNFFWRLMSEAISVEKKIYDLARLLLKNDQSDVFYVLIIHFWRAPCDQIFKFWPKIQLFLENIEILAISPHRWGASFRFWDRKFRFYWNFMYKMIKNEHLYFK